MAGVAEAMAASSILLEGGSVASSGTRTVRGNHSQRPDVARSCICMHPRAACRKLSAAFGMLNDLRGNFVQLPSNEVELRQKYYHYLDPDSVNDQDDANESVGGRSRSNGEEGGAGSEGSYSNGSRDEGSYGSDGNSAGESRSSSGSEGHVVNEDSGGAMQQVKGDLSELTEIEDLPDEFVAAHHFHPDIIACHFKLYQYDRTANDLLPFPSHTISANERRSCGVSIERDFRDRVQNVGDDKEQVKFWIVPSYPLDVAYADWKQLMRKWSRDVSTSSSGRQHKSSAHRAKGQATITHRRHSPTRQDDFSSVMGKWEMAYAMANHVVDTSERSSSTFARQESVAKNTAVASDNLAAAVKKVHSTRLNTNKRDPPAREIRVWKASNDGGIVPAPEAITDDMSESEPSQTSIISQQPTSRSEGPNPALTKKPSTSLASPTANVPTVAISNVPTVARPFLGYWLPIGLYCAFLVGTALCAFHVVRVLDSRESALVCSTPACKIASARTSWFRAAETYLFAVTPDIPRYLELSKAMTEACWNFVLAVAAKLPIVRLMVECANAMR
ncbi:expressed unknown protein [Seminavis robusta]|uniref:Uncharacterized protein n=1 Tax=Seminavis robusta TaxID=568900 RepID=A0A9N8HHQ2_9STRA|nr:expressed unknown protein [Seminavis robusta]|eukprot:Sro576_g169480.1 n/a (560) ;mRNA; f:13024-14703